MPLYVYHEVIFQKDYSSSVCAYCDQFYLESIPEYK